MNISARTKALQENGKKESLCFKKLAEKDPLGFLVDTWNVSCERKIFLSEMPPKDYHKAIRFKLNDKGKQKINQYLKYIEPHIIWNIIGDVVGKYEYEYECEEKTEYYNYINFHKTFLDFQKECEIIIDSLINPYLIPEINEGGLTK